ncbi:MAG: [FeFe] hydrogenase H-cluster radical SAM maturase HydG [Ruminococcaceae bacterium]|nr:[FeFe] hydrogenase H-cluster radical SAM maturase HydG [Oscillospiraceae bacterium]
MNKTATLNQTVPYDPKSPRAEAFINHQEILDTLDYAWKNRHNAALADTILEKARKRQGLTHREAAVLLDCALPEKQEEMFRLAEQIKRDFYGNRIVLFAPLYLSNYCVNSCVYCPYHCQNKQITRKKLTQQEIRDEVIALQDMGHKRLALEAGEDPVNNPLEYILESIDTIYSTKHKNGAIRRVNVNIAATTAANYTRLRDAGIGTYILFQETYHKESYEQLHPRGPKHDYAWHTEAMDRAMAGGIDDVGLGVLFGLELYRYELAGLLMHAEHLEAAFGVGPHTISVPRICPADDIDPGAFDNGISDDIFLKLVAIIRLAAPYTGMIVSTRESQACREKALRMGISQISGGSRTSVGGYAKPEPKAENSAQFDVSDNRTLDEVVRWLMEMGHIPSFCTACYREGRTGDRFMSLCKSGQIQNCCHPNALITLKEYLEDYAAPATATLGDAMVQREIQGVPNPKVRSLVAGHLEKIHAGARDFRL